MKYEYVYILGIIWPDFVDGLIQQLVGEGYSTEYVYSVYPTMWLMKRKINYAN